MERNIILSENVIGVKEQRHLFELSGFNRALNNKEFLAIVKIYDKAIERTIKEAKEQGIEI